MLQIQVLTNRHLVSAPFFGNSFGFEDAFVDSCEADLIYPVPRPLYNRVIQKSIPAHDQVGRFLRKTNSSFQALPETALAQPGKGLNALFILAQNGSVIHSLEAIPQWRQRYDIVVAYIFDCWVVEALPKSLAQFDHIFVPFQDAKPLLEKHFKVPVSVLPFGTNVSTQGSPRTDRFIDVTGYGRGCLNYHKTLFDTFNQPDSDLVYYVHSLLKTEFLPKLPYGPQRDDYQHTALLTKMLCHSKAALAFSNTYTSSTQSTMQHHVAHRSTFPVLGYRWFEISAAGTAVLGRRPETPLIDQYLGWEDATIELPDDPQTGLEFICDLLADKDRMAAIHRRNYYENLIRNDWRHRIKAMFETLAIPLPEQLQAQLKAKEEEYQQACQSVYVAAA
jgi:hypothetical protein